MVTVDKCIRVYPNTKPWMTREVWNLLQERNTAFRCGNGELYSAARANLKKGIRRDKTAYRRRIEDCFQSQDSRRVWQGVQHITNHRPSTLLADYSDASLAENLNSFFAHFEVQPPETVIIPSPAHNSHALTLEEQEVRRMLRGVNSRKAAGPDSVSGRVLRECAAQLASVFTNIFNQSMSQAAVPRLKSTIIVPLPKKTRISDLNDYRPVALTLIIMKCFEKLVRAYVTPCLPPGLDPHQFAYCASRSTEDAIIMALHAALSHLEQQGS
ncbi:uncharacterized protein LOC117514629 [Thalassophryne amazonica]|uniref:uncharacterized protein LOC117514629 n=1 Tax=Thalassophryne amazonica TaxID=390379 RepID=UPI001471545D|nr:uncharacterized protein LOC117514629 [Thalassophryne amazonica]